MLSSLIVLAAEETEQLAPLALPIWAFPVIAAVFFLLAGLITVSYRDVANRHANRVGHPVDATDDPHGNHH